MLQRTLVVYFLFVVQLAAAQVSADGNNAEQTSSVDELLGSVNGFLDGGNVGRGAPAGIPPGSAPANRRESPGDGPLLSTIPSVGGTVESFRFFTADGDPPPASVRVYQTEYSRATLKTVFYELNIKYATESEAKFTVTAIWKYNNSPLARQELTMNKPVGWNTSTRTYGHGHREAGKWEAGRYTVDIEVDGRHVASGSFVVY